MTASIQRGVQHDFRGVVGRAFGVTVTPTVSGGDFSAFTSLTLAVTDGAGTAVSGLAATVTIGASYWSWTWSAASLTTAGTGRYRYELHGLYSAAGPHPLLAGFLDIAPVGTPGVSSSSAVALSVTVGTTAVSLAVTVGNAAAEAGSGANLAYTSGASSGIVTSDSGTDATIPAATGAIAGLLTAADFTKLSNIEAAADVTDAANVNTAGAVMEADYGAQTILAATLDDTPAALTVAEQTVVGRITGGNVTALTATQVRTLINVEDGADVTDATNVAAAGAVMESDTGTGSMSFVIDEDNMASDSATKVPTQQSVKAYADLKVPKATFPDSVTIACSDMTTALTNTGNPKAYWVNPYGVTLTLTDIKATLATAGTATSTVIDVNEGAAGGTTLMNTNKITIEADETDSDDATTQPTLTDTSIASKGRITIDVDSVGTGAAGLQVTLFFTRAV